MTPSASSGPSSSLASSTLSAAPEPSKQAWFVYLLECEDGSLYTGIALDVERRFICHALGTGAAYTRSHPPLRVLACRCCIDKGAALRAEHAIKQLPRERKLGFFDATERLNDATVPLRRPPSARLKPAAVGQAPS